MEPNETETITPECCKRCSCLLPGGDCDGHGKRCVRWSKWFHREWASIRKAAALLKEN